MKVSNSKLTPGQKAKKTGQWAKIMTKWLITYSMRGGKKWHFVSFEGVNGGESTGIVDFIAIRRHHEFCENPFKRADCFEIILIQVKGGSACMPSFEDKKRLLKVKEYYKAKRVLLSSWHKGDPPTLYNLVKLKEPSWKIIDPKEAFQ